MLAALIAFQNEGRVTPQPSTIKIELRGGGGPRIPMYDIVDYLAAVATFPEIAGEDSVAKAARRERWLTEQLPLIRERRERREGAAFLAGAAVATSTAEAAAEEALRARILRVMADMNAEEARANARANARDRSTHGNPIGPLVALSGAVAIVAALATRKRR